MEQEEKNDSVTIFQGNKPVAIYVSETENSAVRIAVNNLLCDIKKVFGCEALLTNSLQDANIVVGTVTTEQINKLIEQKDLKIDEIKSEEGAVHWEAFLQQLKDEVLYIIG